MSNLLKPVAKADVTTPDSPFSALQREVNRLFTTFDRGWPMFSSFAFTPSTDIVESENEIRISAELPGLEQKDVKVELVQDVLTISGEKKSEKEENSEKRHMVERSYGAFSRSVQLPEGVKPEDIGAKIQNGVLTVTVKKPAAQKVEPRKIAIESAA